MVKRQNVVVTLAAVKPAHHRLLGAVENPQDAALPASVGLGAQHVHLHTVAVQGRGHAIPRNVDVLIGAPQRHLGNDESVAVTMPNQAAGGHVRSARAPGKGQTGWGARRRWRGRVGVRSFGEGEVVLFKINNAFLAGEAFKCTLQLARLAGSQTEFHHQLTKTERLARLSRKNFQNFLGRCKFAHGKSIHYSITQERWSDRGIAHRFVERWTAGRSAFIHLLNPHRRWPR